MSVWTASEINRFRENGEDDYLSRFPCLLDRLALDIKKGVHSYELPDYCVDIKRVTWKGTKLDPLPHRYFREGFIEGSVESSGKPFWYIFNNVGQGIIRLYPTPPEDIPVEYLGLWSTEIKNKCIVEFYRTTDCMNFVIPSYFRNRLLKTYVSYQSFSVENQGQNLRVSKYFSNKWQALCKLYSSTLNDLMNKPRKIIIQPGTGQYQVYPGAPILPIDRYGIGVRTGE